MLICLDSISEISRHCSSRAFRNLSDASYEIKSTLLRVVPPTDPPPIVDFERRFNVDTRKPYILEVGIRSKAEFVDMTNTIMRNGVANQKINDTVAETLVRMEGRAPPIYRRMYAREPELRVHITDCKLSLPSRWGTDFRGKIIVFSSKTDSNVVEIECYPKNQNLMLSYVDGDPNYTPLTFIWTMRTFTREITVRLRDFIGLERRLVERGSDGVKKNAFYQLEKLHLVLDMKSWRPQYKSYLKYLYSLLEKPPMSNLVEFTVTSKYKTSMDEPINRDLLLPILAFCGKKCPMLKTLTIAGVVSGIGPGRCHLEFRSSSVTHLSFPATRGSVLLDCPKLEVLTRSTDARITRAPGTNPRKIELRHSISPGGIIFAGEVEARVRDAEHVVLTSGMAAIVGNSDSGCVHLNLPKLKTLELRREPDSGYVSKFANICFSSPRFEELCIDGKKYSVDELPRDSAGHFTIAKAR